MGIVVDVVSNVAASLVVLALGWFVTFRLRRRIFAWLSRAMGSGVSARFKNDREASRMIVKAVRQSDSVRIFSMRAFRLLKDDADLAFLLSEHCSIGEVRVLLADASSDSVLRRAKEFVHIDPAYTVERYIEDIRWSGRQVAANQANPKLTMRLHHEPAFVRLLITDGYLFLSFFLRDTHGDNSPVLQIRRTSPLYESFKRYFDAVWDHNSMPYTDNSSSRAEEKFDVRGG